ncbi:hypothetical protein F4824DRAFT_499122 [Ustulina deusta]|nr:hypothetical protein F4824DRAFT_499122 [Ustulina deusta]
MHPDNVDTMISPNPILVKSSRIEGLFDKISGWCSISTGFTMVFKLNNEEQDEDDEMSDIDQEKVSEAKPAAGTPNNPELKRHWWLENGFSLAFQVCREPSGSFITSTWAALEATSTATASLLTRSTSEMLRPNLAS